MSLKPNKYLLVVGDTRNFGIDLKPSKYRASILSDTDMCQVHGIIL